MTPYIYTATILMCLYIFAHQLSVNGIALTDSFDNLMNTIDENFNFMLKSSEMLRSEYSNSSNQLKLPNLLDSFSSLMNRKPSKFVWKMCNSNTGQLCEYYGYKSESFTVTTTDGYILTIFRCYGTITKSQPVLLIHGMMDSSDTWVMNPGNKSLAYNYIERGYDVYLINCRGDRYSQQHTTLHSHQSAFWNFTWQEMARYDVPETINVILKRTGSPTIQCVGHSQGGSVLLALLATTQRYNQIISHAGLFAPFTFMNRIGFPINAVIAAFYRFDYQHYWQFLPHTFLQKIAAHTVCNVFNGKLCNLFLNFILGPSLEQLDPEMWPVYACHFPAGASSKQVFHFGQELHCNYFGEVMEVKPPVCPHPLPSFNLSSITTALSLFYSPTDPHTNPVDIGILQKSLTNANLATKELYKYNHLDYVWGKNAAIDVYNVLIARAARFEST